MEDATKINLRKGLENWYYGIGEDYYYDNDFILLDEQMDGEDVNYDVKFKFTKLKFKATHIHWDANGYLLCEYYILKKNNKWEKLNARMSLIKEAEQKEV